MGAFQGVLTILPVSFRFCFSIVRNISSAVTLLASYSTTSQSLGHVHFDRLDTRKPIQGLFDLVRSGVSDELEPFAHAIDVQRDLARVGLAASPSRGRRVIPLSGGSYFRLRLLAQLPGASTKSQNESKESHKSSRA